MWLKGKRKFLMTRTTPSSPLCCKRKVRPGCTYTLLKRYAAVSAEASSCTESLGWHEGGAGKLYLVLDGHSLCGEARRAPGPVVLAVKPFATASDDILLWDVAETRETRTLLFGGGDAANAPRGAPESSGKPSEGQLLRVKEVLADSLPKLFVKPLEYSIYHPNIVFENNITGKRTVGLAEYMKQMSFLKIVGHFKFAYVNLEILKISMHPEDSSVKVRWRIKGISGLKVFITFWKFKLWKIKEIFEQQEAWYDGFSTFYVGQDGLIHKHVADKMMPDSDRAVDEQKTDVTAKLALFTGLVPSLGNSFPLAFLSAVGRHLPSAQARVK
ncbi:uncharacterized protein LOC134537915 isoform X2 [Bacillus rossius redtenbacheri]|uniref:uncharacterized protein LOC134537915 isoform X2 n=1 Tax=Bacillus rossius redtenbacheri TaxID=93214 RepID=UPI002FDE69AF